MHGAPRSSVPGLRPDLWFRSRVSLQRATPPSIRNSHEICSGGEAWRGPSGEAALVPHPFALCTGLSRLRNGRPPAKPKPRPACRRQAPNGVVTLSRSRPAREDPASGGQRTRPCPLECRGFGRPDVARSRARGWKLRATSQQSPFGAVPSSPSPYPVGRGCRQAQPGRASLASSAEVNLRATLGQAPPGPNTTDERARMGRGPRVVAGGGQGRNPP